MSAPFVGRELELRTLSGQLMQTRRQGASAAALITGEPGSGKSRLLGEFLRLSGTARTVRVVGFEPSQSIPLAAAGDLLHRLATSSGHGALLEDLVFGDRDPRSRDPLRIFEAAHRALTALGALVLAIDDLQWVDEQSMALIHYMQRASAPEGPPLVVVAAARPSPAAAAFRASLEAQIPTERRTFIELGPLPLADGVSLARAIDDGIDEHAAGELWRRARGSPFWLEVLARARGTDDPASLIRDRLRALSGAAGELLAALSIVAHPVAAGDVARMLGWEGQRVSHTVEGAGLLEDLLWARLDLGRAFVRIDRQRSVEQFAQAAELADSIGAASQHRLSGQALRSLGVRAWRRGRATHGDRLDSLSQREREVVRLVADGRSNREIAEALLVSPKTVERHLTNVLAKLGLRNLTELAVLVHGSVRGSPDE